MYHSRFSKTVLFCCTIIFLSACASRPHNNVLIFGTDTKFGLDISSEATQGNYPEVTLGYKRREAVYLPLSRNEYDCKNTNSGGKKCTINNTEDKYLALSDGINEQIGGSKGESDAYSVFASFGAKFSAGAQSSGDLAQYFATGVAAQRLGANKNIEKTLSVRSGEAEVAIAEKEAALAKARLESLENELNNVVGEDKQVIATRESKINKILDCANLSNTEGKWKSILEHAKTDSSLSTSTKKWLARLNNKKEKKYWKAQLRSNDEVIKSMSVAVNKLCP